MAVAGQESSFGKFIPASSPFNYWGLGVYNDSNTGLSFNSIDEAVQEWCDLMIEYKTPGTLCNEIASRNAGQYSVVNSKFNKNIVSIYDVWSAYAYLGDYHKGMVYEPVNVKNFITTHLKDVKCNHTLEDATTVEEKAAYIVWYVENGIIKIAEDVFGEKYIMEYNTDLIQIAESCVGKTANEIGLFGYVDQNGCTYPATEWCAMFVSYCYSKAGLMPSRLRKTFFVCDDPTGPVRVNETKDYVPKAGDLIVIDWNVDNSEDHVELVVSCDGAYVTTIGGNRGEYYTSSIVKKSSWSVSDPIICCYFTFK